MRLVEPAPGDATHLHMTIFLPQGDGTDYSFLLGGQAPPGPSEIIVAPNERWVTLELFPTEHGYLRVVIEAVRHCSSDKRVQGYYVDGHRVYANGVEWRRTSWFVSNEGGDLGATLAPNEQLSVEVEADSQDIEFEFGCGAGWQNWLEGDQEPMAWRLLLTMGRSGLEEDPGVRLSIFGNVTAYELNVLDSGPFRMADPDVFGVSTSVMNVGPQALTMESHITAGSDPSFIIAAVGLGTPSEGRHRYELGFDGESKEFALREDRGFSMMWNAECPGIWTSRLDYQGGHHRPTSTIVVADGLVLSDFARSAWGARTDCSLEA